LQLDAKNKKEFLAMKLEQKTKFTTKGFEITVIKELIVNYRTLA
jgi:hypothetical protein